MRFAREGYPFIGVSTVAAVLAWSAVGYEVGGRWAQAAAALLSLLATFVLWFFRDPERSAPLEPGIVVAPGEGRVIRVEESEEPTFLGGVCRKVSIFLSVFDVHVQRSPMSGIVEHRHYRPGAYAVAWRDKASEDNEQASLGLATPHGRVLVRQIAGLVARRIVTYPTEGQSLARGERIGLIRFGSRVDLFFPLDWEVACTVGDRARAGLTVVARHPMEDRS